MYKIKQIPGDFIVEEIPLFKAHKSGSYTYFFLQKKNYTTEKAIQKISLHFKIPRKRFGYAGNKDKDAVTKQYCSVKGKITDIKFKDIQIKVIGYGDKPISLGDLRGNKFIITIRNVKKPPNNIDFIINYFDEQRFGRHNLDIGLAILKKNFKKAAELIDLLESKNHLAKNPNDYIGSIKKVPFKILKLYVHAVQSFFWNEAATLYIKSKTKSYTEIKYKHGVFIFPNRIKNIKLQLISFDTVFNKNIKPIYDGILKQHNLSLRDFVIRQIPEITPFGNTRDLKANVKNLLFINKSTVKFELQKGSYATIVIKRIMSC